MRMKEQYLWRGKTWPSTNALILFLLSFSFLTILQTIPDNEGFRCQFTST